MNEPGATGVLLMMDTLPSFLHLSCSHLFPSRQQALTLCVQTASLPVLKTVGNAFKTSCQTWLLRAARFFGHS